MRTRLLAVMMTVTVSPALSQRWSDAEKARLREIDKAWAEATNRGDRAQLEAIFADDFASTDITGSQNKATTGDARNIRWPGPESPVMPPIDQWHQYLANTTARSSRSRPARPLGAVIASFVASRFELNNGFRLIAAVCGFAALFLGLRSTAIGQHGDSRIRNALIEGAMFSSTTRRDTLQDRVLSPRPSRGGSLDS